MYVGIIVYWRCFAIVVCFVCVLRVFCFGWLPAWGGCWLVVICFRFWFDLFRRVAICVD